MSKYKENGEDLLALIDRRYYKEPEKVICEECEGTGIEYYSCCGDDMRANINETDLCPSCLEHCGTDGEKCQECNGEGYI